MYVYAIEYKESEGYNFNTPIICQTLEDVNNRIKNKPTVTIDNTEYYLFSVNRYELNKDYRDEVEVPCCIFFTKNDSKIKDISNGVDYITDKDFKI